MTDPFIRMSKDRSGRVVVAISFDWLLEFLLFPQKLFLTVFSSVVRWLVGLPYPSTQFTLAVASAGLGLGLVVALFGQVLVRPSQTMAIPTFVGQVHQGPLVDTLQLNNKSYSVFESTSLQDFFALPKNKLAQWVLAGRPGESQAVVLMVGYTHPARSELQQVQLGQEIELVGHNNGRYTYQVVATQVKTFSELAHLSTQQKELLLIVPQTLSQQDFLLVQAK